MVRREKKEIGGSTILGQGTFSRLFSTVGHKEDSLARMDMSKPALGTLLLISGLVLMLTSMRQLGPRRV